MVLDAKVAQFPKRIIGRSHGVVTMEFQYPPHILKFNIFLYYVTEFRVKL